MGKFVVGIDIGGTNIKLGLISLSGHVAYRTSFVTKGFVRDKADLIKVLTDRIKEIIAGNKAVKKDIIGIGIGLPGIINSSQGIVSTLVNIPGWKNVPLKKIIEKKLGLNTFIDNDVNLMALGEWKYGAGNGLDNIVCLTLGTGVGGGLIINGQLYRGPSFSAGELGHIPIDIHGLRCNCGGTGCLERYVGNQTLLNNAKKIFRNPRITLEEVSRMAVRGNRQAIHFWEHTGQLLGVALTGVVNLLNPQRIVIGGGVANAHRALLMAVRRTIKQRAMRIPATTVDIVKATLGNNAGILGAQVYVGNQLQHN